MVQPRRGELTTSEYEDIEKCIAAIDLNNACRQFYITKVESTERCKQEVQKQQTERKTARAESAIDSSLSTLRKEMISLMDQDVSLMKQLLILNEQVEELKSKRLHAMSKESFLESSQNLCGSHVSFSDTDMFGTESNISDIKNVADEKENAACDEKICSEQCNRDISVKTKQGFLQCDQVSVDSLYTSGDHLLDCCS